MLSHNEHQMKEAVKLCKDLGANKLVFKTAQLYDVNANSHMLPKHTRYSRYILNKEGKYTIKVQKQRGCYKMWHTAVITWEGDVVPCCYDKDAEYVMGNLKEQSFRNIWRGEKYKRFREMVLSKRGIIPMCSMCSEK
ncbi:MAG: S-adenosyl-L-methionine-dependent 2-deoxy-scyllo-inosamine dehydrogenase [Bacteroidetes bacterium ADurb.Bin408]|nr:MAG: S-adenosyl-L-methionine-dependent 2-deoxy-scyllo-inosamine dehydrogenase [Bacteroidetes bacterium ADurb.Bin408]